ncbi:alpha-2-macroglobulin-like protein 1 [Passer montanus]|uniref:alpha-2-macroglobulin-like protein 1 n=1 Tax=Passer montanus TaxID=9160 RepID=UPI00195FDB0E|nr:alpha-2-macroglobulin-like protein 1 [Passer montanus]
MWTPFLLSCLLCTLGIVAQPRYLIIIPAALPYPSSQRACLDLRGVEKPIRVALTLVHPSGNLSLYRKVVRNDWIFECTRFQVPRPAGSQEVATVHLHISNGHYFSASEDKKVLIHRAGTGTFIQMDKPIYNPGQTVKFRIVTLTEDFVPVNSKYSMVEIQDPNQNRIGQWLDVRPKQGVADLSFHLADELSLGTYTISAQSFKSNSVQSTTFKVEERVLQKFDVFFEGPTQIYASDKTFPLQVCGRYSFGKAVRGTVHVTLCQKARRWPQNASKDICREYSGPTASNGCFTPSVSTSVFNLTPSEEDNKLYAEASLLEMGTGVQINTSSQILISRTAARAVFETPNEYYIPGVPYRGKIKVQDHYGTGMKNRKVYLVIRFMRRRFIKTYITDDSGIASFNLDTTAWNSSSVSLEVTGKSGIVVRGQRNIQIGKLNSKSWQRMLKGSFSIPLTFTADLSPSPSLVVYAIFPNGGVTADSIRLDVALCFQNQVKVRFPGKEAHAGSAVQLQLQAAPGSLCAVQAVDENMFFTRPDRELTSQMVYGLFPAAYQRGYPAQVEEHSDRCVQPQSLSSLLRGRPQQSFQPDIFNLFRNMGLKVFSNLVIKKPSQCSRRMDRKPIIGVPSTEDQRINEEQPQFTTHRRSHHYFPETWLWNVYSVGGSREKKSPVPNMPVTPALAPPLSALSPLCCCAILITVPISPGYQTQLLYKHRDGSYSFFGPKDGEGNTWLTAFVLKNFGQARKYIYIDDKNIQDALRWLEQNQLPSGCFATKGNFFHSSLKGSMDDEVSLGAYVAAALLEMGLPLQGKLMQTTLRCLQKVVHNITNIYTEALLAYAFALAGDYETTQELLYKLEEQAIKSGGQIHWSPKPSSPSYTDFRPGTQSVDIELTAYVLLAYLSKPRVHAGDMTTAAGIVAWLMRQQNAYGGFASTQDTAVALQALAKYAARTFSTSGQAVVRVRSQRAFGKAFQVSRQQRLLVQQAALVEIPGQFLLQAHGSSCIFTQTVLRYHKRSPGTPVIFTLRVSTELNNCSQANPRVLTVRILTSYIGSRVTSNMVIIEVSLLSGFIMTSRSRVLLENRTIVKKIEVKANVVYIYLEKLNDESQTFILQLEQVIQVKNLKPAGIKIYDYYQPEERALAEYSAVCS